MLSQIANSWICWAIIGLAAFCFYQLWSLWLLRKLTRANNSHTRSFVLILINTLPLLGLFGTIVGLLDSFSALAHSGVPGEKVSKGISDALVTTKLGLMLAIPAWVMLYSLPYDLDE